MFFLVDCNIPDVITGILYQIYKIIIIIVPVGIVVFGSIDFVKGIIAKDQDAISRNTKTFITRLITGIITFFVFNLVSIIFSLIANINEASSALKCATDILTGNATYNRPSQGREPGSLAGLDNAPAFSAEQIKQFQCQSQANITGKNAYIHCIQNNGDHNNCVNKEMSAGNSMYNGCMGNN